MKQFLKYNYNLQTPTIYKVKNDIKIKDGNNRYLLCPVINTTEVEELYRLLNYEKISNLFFSINKNKNGKLYSNYNGINYVLLTCINNKEMEKRLLFLSKNISGEIVKTNWKQLWIKKKDYYEKVITSSHQNEYDQILFDYYNAMAETAILYITGKEFPNKRQILTFRVLEKEEIRNPLNLVVDIEEREISEILRQKIINNELNSDVIKDILSQYSHEIDFELVFARLLFPNYYYNGLLKSAINKTQFNILIQEINHYEKSLKLLYEEFRKMQQIKKVDWL